jgi:predicted TPR repeat methyltransferase
LFDRYADTFDEHLREQLQYTLPEKITDAIAAVRPSQPIDILDLGCGTGLCGPLLRPWARHLCGIDLSPAMIEQARARGVYDALEACDLVVALRRAERSFDLLVAADVLLYVGDLSPVFEAAAKCLRPGGLFAYSVESGAGDRYYLQEKSKRFAHSRPYLQKLAAMYGFVEESFESVTARLDAGQPVPAYLAVVRLD